MEAIASKNLPADIVLPCLPITNTNKQTYLCDAEGISIEIK